MTRTGTCSCTSPLLQPHFDLFDTAYLHPHEFAAKLLGAESKHHLPKMKQPTPNSRNGAFTLQDTADGAPLYTRKHIRTHARTHEAHTKACCMLLV
mmetsp:Transcript_76761/g.135558  ORF Transcript_76761/g.135558 Transcript_76761/m.135558 type:complete len:96 (-) Transcript_76761:2337-2624(-)